MRELFERFLMWACFAGIGGIAVAAFVKATYSSAAAKVKLATENAKRQDVVATIAVVLFVGGMFVYGSTKNNTQTNEPEPQTQMLLGSRRMVRTIVPQETTHPSVRALTDEDYEAGFALTRIGTNEIFNFEAPVDAEICEDWRAFGAHSDWQYVKLGTESAECRSADKGWSFVFGTNVIDRLVVFSCGTARPKVKDKETFISPFETSLGIVSVANWAQLGETNSPSQFWQYVTPSNTYVMTWQNALVERDAAQPVSFQTEYWPQGDIVFRYDLSRMEDDIVTNLVVGIRNGGNGRVFSELPRGTTSLTWSRLDPYLAYDTDPDGDGISTEDELLVYHTDPYSADTDMDGLSDYREIFETHTDPNDPHSLSDTYCDGVAIVIGDVNPYDYPEGSTNTVWEYIFYTGTTNTPFAYPQSSDETGVLRVSVSGTGSGELIVGDKVVPLLAPQPSDTPILLSAGDEDEVVTTPVNTLLLSIGKGEKKTIWFRKPDGLDIAIDSEDMLIGELPSLPFFKGWLAFPHTDATIPCIHDLDGGGKDVSLVHGEEFDGLCAEWESDADHVAITNAPPVSAKVYGNFSRNATRSISYTVTHSNLLNAGRTGFTFSQTLRFCPQLTDDEMLALDGNADEDQGNLEASCGCSDYSSCSCCSSVDCRCTSWYCSCRGEQPDTFPEDDEDAAESYTNMTSSAMSEADNVLYLYRANSKTIRLTVPDGEPRHCCPCPEHWMTNYAALASCSSRLAVKGADGGEFNETYTTCDVTVSGVSPSRAFDDSVACFVTNGVVSLQPAFTVLGVGFETESWRPPISKYNQLSTDLGYPFTINTNLDRAVSLRIKSDVLLTNGIVRIAVENATGDLKLHLPTWYDNESNWHDVETLLDTASRTERYFSMREWRTLLARYHAARELEFMLTSSSTGHADLVVEYAVTNGNHRIHDSARQRVTSVNPMLIVDYDRDGKVGAVDRERCLADRYAYFWVNDDKWRGDNAFETYLSANSGNDVIDGRNDLINFLPIAVNIAPFVSHWRSGDVYFRLESDYNAVRNGKIALCDIPWNEIGTMPLGERYDIAGNPLHESPVSSLGGGTNLPPAFVNLSSAGRSTILMEFLQVARYERLYLNIYSKTNDTLLLSSFLQLHVGEVGRMMGWSNLRGAAGGTDGMPTQLDTDDWPTDEHEPGNIVFVHGYNMAEDAEAPLWAKNVFKKLWWAGLNRGFIAVQWFGNEGQTYIPLVGFTTPNYYGNVQNAFRTASALASAMQTVPGPKWFMAHSLGNMLVSDAIQNYGMDHEKYFMLNAAIALEAFDPSAGITAESHDNMTPRSWTNYVDRVRATHWYERFPEGDGRRLLTWKGRFANVTNIVNFYSSEEEVVNNGDGGSHPLIDRNFVWYNQEVRKGLWPMMLHEYEGGWAFNTFYDTVTWSWVGSEHIEDRTRMAPQVAAGLSDSQLQEHPFFLDFANPEMHSSSNGMIVATNPLYRAEMLAYAIPSESYAVGANPMPGYSVMTTNSPSAEVYGNYDMAVLFTTGKLDLPENGEEPEDRHRDWQHSTFVQRSYKRTYKLYKTIMQIIEKGSD